MKPRFKAVGDSALAVELGDAVDPEINRRVHALAGALRLARPAGVIEVAPAYCSLLVYYDPLELRYRDVEDRVAQVAAALDAAPADPPRRMEIPTVYGGAHGPDLEFVAQRSGLTPDEVIRLHSGSDYLVYMMGFTPGFAYLGRLDKRIAAPRLEAPRARVPAGSVGIAGQQTGIYPIDSPGGWRLVGYTPVRPFDMRREPPFLFAPGDLVRFTPISELDLPRDA